MTRNELHELYKQVVATPTRYTQDVRLIGDSTGDALDRAVIFTQAKYWAAYQSRDPETVSTLIKVADAQFKKLQEIRESLDYNCAVTEMWRELAKEGAKT